MGLGIRVLGHVGRLAPTYHRGVPDRRAPLLGSLVVVLAACGFATLGVLSRTTYDLGLTPMGFVVWRSGVAALAMLVLVAWGVRRGVRLVGWRSLSPRDRIALAVAALAGSSLDVTMFFAFARVPVAIVLLGFYLFPAMVALASALLGWERLDRPRVLALVIALGGMVAVVAGGEGAAAFGGLDLVGVLLAIAAAVSQTVFVLVARRGYRDVPAEQAMGVVLVTSTSIAFVIAMVSGVLSSVWLPLSSPELLTIMVVGGVFAAGIPSFLFLVGIRWIGGVKAGILMLAQAPVGVALAAIFLRESIGLVQVAGGVAIIAGAAFIQRPT
jgi:drug/metabolite transporter, DME family